MVRIPERFAKAWLLGPAPLRFLLNRSGAGPENSN